TDPESVIANLVDKMLSDEMAIEIQQRITDIDAAGEAIIQNANSILELRDIVDSLADIDGTGIATYIQNVEQAMIEGDQALAETLALIGAANGDNSAFILDLDSVLVDSETSLGTHLDAIIASVGDNTAA